MRQEREKNGQGQMENSEHTGYSILGEGNTEILFYGIDEHLVRLENWTRILEDGEKEFQ